jgi:DnaJ family protein B protein 12
MGEAYNKKTVLQLQTRRSAAEAFKATGNAAAILTDPEKREHYNMYGSEEKRIQQSQRHNLVGYP